MQISKIRCGSSVFWDMAGLTMTPTGHPGPKVKQEQFRGKTETAMPGYYIKLGSNPFTNPSTSTLVIKIVGE
jgi:hypothetical protein